MKHHHRTTAFTFAEIMVAAPWAYSIIAKAQDNDKAWMLQRNTWPDEGSAWPDTLELDRLARVARTEHVRNLLRQAGAWLASLGRRRSTGSPARA